MPYVTIQEIVGGGGGGPVPLPGAMFVPTTEYTVRLVKPNVTTPLHSEYRWVREGLWQYAEVPLGMSGGPDSPSLLFDVNHAGQVKVEIDRWAFAQIWEEADFNEGGAPIRYLVPESVTMWVFRGASQPLWAGFLRDIEADPTASNNVTLTGEEFIGEHTDINLTDDWSIIDMPVGTALEQALSRELRTAWMHVHYHGPIDGTFGAEYTQIEQRRISEIIDQLATAGEFEWQQWIGPALEDGTWEAYFGVHPGKAGFDFQTLGLHIEWGQGTAETAWKVRYSFSGRGMRTRWSVIGADDTIKIRDYNIPLGVPRRDGSVRDSAIPSDLVAATAENYVRRQGLPQLTVRAVLRVGDEAEGMWPFLWLYGTAGVDGTGGCSPVGSRFYTKIVDAGMVYEAILRASTWGIAVVPGGEYIVLDLVQDEAAAQGLLLEMQTVV